MLYDSLYEKYGDRQTALKHYRKIRVPLMVICFILIPAACVSAAYLLNGLFQRKGSPMSAAVIWACSAGLTVLFFMKDLKKDYRFVRCRHDIGGLIKPFEKGGGTCLKTDGGDGFVFSFTSENDAITECTFCDGVYTFTVKNDEWDETASFTAGTEEEFEQTAKKALSFAAALEKRPGGEYDESLEPEVEIDEYEDFPEEEEEEAEPEEDTEEETDDRPV